jgi:hypothetical protein
MLLVMRNHYKAFQRYISLSYEARITVKGLSKFVRRLAFETDFFPNRMRKMHNEVNALLDDTKEVLFTINKKFIEVNTNY